MKKLLIKTMPGIFLVTVTCCGGNSGSISDSFKKADYTKYKTEQTQKSGVFSKKH